jgi:hypothetical protein
MEVKIHDAKNNKFKDLFRKRPPIPILLICIFEFLGLLLLPSAFGSEKSANLGLLYQIYLVLTGVLSIAIIYSLWKMKKIGILIYIGSYVIHNVVALIVGNWMIGVLIIPFIGLILIGLSRNKFK